jgi:hypothetical protein
LLLLRKGLGLETEKVDLLSMFFQFNSTKNNSYFAYCVIIIDLFPIIINYFFCKKVDFFL